MNKRVLTWSIAATLAAAAEAHGPSGHGARHAEGAYDVVQTDFGIPGYRKQVRRTIIVDMDDDMRYTPPSVEVEQGDTIRFVLRNKGEVLHEWVLGTDAELKAHAEMMRKFPDMEHDEVHMVHVAPGKSDEIVWRFNRMGKFYFACLIPGHYEAGMVGAVTVAPKGESGHRSR